MRRALVILAEAEEELDEQVDYLSERSLRAGIRLIEAIQKALEDIRTMPDAGSPRHAREPGLSGVRAWRVDGFPELQIFYRVTDDAIEIAHLWHAKRDLSGLGRGSEKP